MPGAAALRLMRGIVKVILRGRVLDRAALVAD
jgi:hypothetical protein